MKSVFLKFQFGCSLAASPGCAPAKEIKLLKRRLVIFPSVDGSVSIRHYSLLSLLTELFSEA
jgi:hypothetical protein